MLAVTVPRLNNSVLRALFVTASLTACAEDNPDRLVASAQSYLVQGNPAAAVIQARNALQHSPEDGALRLLLGRALLENRDPVAAERELRKALQYEQAPDGVLPLLARAMLEQDEGLRLVDELSARTLVTPEAEADLKSTLGHAQLRLGRLGDAAASFDASLAATPGHLPALIGSARLSGGRGHVGRRGAARRSLNR